MEVEPIEPSPDAAVINATNGSGAAAIDTANSGVEEGRPFLCGVVEGFYNRPWTQNQRVDLYKKLNTFGLNAYLYAPKDDVKHRALWREKYTANELQNLKILIDGCKENDVVFYYGISPGLDMTYSSADDLGRLKAKLDQLVGLGCRGFAVLWDDIDTHLRPGDSGAFNSLADAHVKICNQVYEHLKSSNSCYFDDTRANWFLTCPVEYCANRAEPNVAQSHYLNTLGAGLDPEIGVFWTGRKVVSDVITKEEILALSAVLRRKPLIWDNLHANDYDQQRMFLGPYSGRAPELIPLLMGVFTNPNCEYSLNVPALFTLAAWSNCYNPRTGAISSWSPVVAAELAIPHFLEEIHRPTMVTPAAAAANNPTENDEAGGGGGGSGGGGGGCAVNAAVPSSPVSGSGELDREDIELLFHFFWLPHANGPKAQIIINYFKQLIEDAHIIQKLGLYNKRAEEMVDEGSNPESSPPPPPSTTQRTAAAAAAMDADSSGASSVDMEDLHESAVALTEPRPERNLRSNWLRKASYFNDICRRYSRLFDKLTFMENRELFFDINGYMTNLNFTLQSCNRFLKWVGVERCTNPISGGPTLSGLPGGVAGDLMRLYPVRSNAQYPLMSLEPVQKQGEALVCRPVLKKQVGILGPAFSRLVCESHGVSEAEVPDDVIKVLQTQRVGAFLNTGSGGEGIGGAGGVGGSGVSVHVHEPVSPVPSCSPDAAMAATSDFKAVVIEDSEDKVIAALVGSRNVGQVVKTLQQVFDTAKTLDSSHLPIALPNDELPWYSLSSYDCLMTFAATPRILFTKVLANALKMFFDLSIAMNGNNPNNNPPDSGGGGGPPPICKYGILMEKTSLISIEFLIEQGFRKVGNYSNFVVLDIEVPQ